MTTTTVKQILNSLFADLSDALLYHSTSPASDKGTILTARDRVRDALALSEAEPKETKEDFSVVVPGRTIKARKFSDQAHIPVWELSPEDVVEVTIDPTAIYFVDNQPYTNKILAIKAVRTRDNNGLKEAKDYVDNLPTKATRDSFNF